MSKPVRVLDAQTGITIPGSKLVIDSQDTDVKVILPKPQILQGYVSDIGKYMMAVSSVLLIFGIEIPTTELNTVLKWFTDNAESLLFLAGAVLDAYGRLRRLWRKPAVITSDAAVHETPKEVHQNVLSTKAAVASLAKVGKDKAKP